jgi:hypothetical protein
MLLEQGTRERHVERTRPLTGPFGCREHVDTDGLLGLAADADDNVVIYSDLVARLGSANPRGEDIAGATVVPLEPVGRSRPPAAAREYALEQSSHRAGEGERSHVTAA